MLCEDNDEVDRSDRGATIQASGASYASWHQCKDASPKSIVSVVKTTQLLDPATSCRPAERSYYSKYHKASKSSNPICPLKSDRERASFCPCLVDGHTTTRGGASHPPVHIYLVHLDWRAPSVECIPDKGRLHARRRSALLENNRPTPKRISELNAVSYDQSASFQKDRRNEVENDNATVSSSSSFSSSFQLTPSTSSYRFPSSFYCI